MHSPCATTGISSSAWNMIDLLLTVRFQRQPAATPGEGFCLFEPVSTPPHLRPVAIGSTARLHKRSIRCAQAATSRTLGHIVRRWTWPIEKSEPAARSSVGCGVTCSPTCPRLIARGSWGPRLSSGSRLPHTWSGETTRARRPGSPPTKRGYAAAKRSAPTLCVLASARALIPGQPSSSDGLGRPRWPAPGGAVATAKSRPGCGCSRLCRACSKGTQTCIRASSRRGRLPRSNVERNEGEIPMWLAAFPSVRPRSRPAVRMRMPRERYCDDSGCTTRRRNG